jgi:serine protease inhibitor
MAMGTRWLLFAAILAAGTPAQAEGGTAVEPAAALVKGNSEFAFDLYGRLRARDGNVVFSSYSISNALAMTYAGARGPTAMQMAATLHFPFEDERLHRAFAALIRDLNGEALGRRAELYVANALWPQTGLPMNADFQAIAKKHYRVGLTPLDFKRAPEKARATINTWVEQQTQDRIKDLVAEGVLTPITRLVLTNAIYFKGRWMRPFPAEATRKDKFTLSPGRAVDVPLMRQRGTFRYLDSSSVQALELLYEAGELSMVALLPRSVDGLSELERTLTAARLSDWVAQMTNHRVDVTLPKFKATAQFDLKQALSELGMPLAFSAAKADFSGITKAEPLSLSAVIHKAYVDVNEEGTEAAAATAPVAVAASAPRPLPEAVFRADHPFFFVIRDGRTGSLLFAGRVSNPQGQ